MPYSQPGTDPWALVVRGISVAAIALGITDLFYSATQFMPFGTSGFSAAVRADLTRPLTLLMLFLELVFDAGSVGLIVAGAACAARRAWVPKLMVISAATLAVASILQAATRVLDSLGRVRLPMGYYLFMTLASVARGLILPALLIWFMTRPPMRRHFFASSGS